MLKPSFYDSEKVVPALEFYDDKGVRLRSQRNLNCDVIATLNRGNLNGFYSGESDKINAIKKAQAELEAEWLKLKIMYNGTEDGSSAAISETTVRTAMKKRCSVLACDYDTMIDEIFTADVLTSSNAIASEDVSQAIIDVNSWFETEETRKETALNNVITNLKADQNEARAVYTASVEENAELTEAQKNKLHKLAVAASRDDITAEEKANAKNEFNDYKNSLLKISVKNKNTEDYKNYKKDLKDLSIAAYGNNTWSTDVYLKDLYSLWHNIYPTTLDYSVSTESYTATALADFKQIVLTQFDYAEEVKLRMLKDQQDKERKQLATKRDAWEKQMAIIINIAEAEWDKAGESLVSGYNEWKTAFNKELEEKDTQWYENYSKFLQKKQDWIDRQYLYAVNVANSNVIARSGLDAESEIAQALADAEVAKLNFKPIDPETYTDILIGESGLSKLMNSIESLQNRGKGAAVTRKHGYKINTASIEAQHAAEEMMLQIENDMKNASAKLAAEQAERMVQDSIKASMERIDSENENMRTWEENMVRRSGYHVDGKNIYRDAVVDSTIGKTYYEGQSVHYYEDFYNAGPTISVSLSKTMLDGLNSSAIMLLVEQANYDIENWSKQVFGNTEKDEEGNVVLKQNAVVRDSSYNDDVDRFKTLSKKDYDKLSDSERKELNGLSTGIVSVRDGALGEWTGYAPVFKDGNSGLDLSNSRESNIKYQGSGQMGQIMLDFQWNCMIEQQGWQKVALPAYDQPLWRGNGSWFEPPTIRGVASIVFEIVGQASSQAWFSYADDVIFAAIDLGGGFKSPEQVGLDLAKTAATAVISMGCSSAGSAVGKVADASLKGAGKVLAKAGISAATSYATSVGTSFVNNWNLDANGNLKFDADNFGKSTYSAQTIAGSVGAGVTAGLTTAANMKMQKMGDNGAAVNKFYGTAINAGISAAGKLSEYAVYSAYALAEGRSLADAYDDMGGLTFNIGSLGMFADMMASGIARNNATGQAGKFGEIAQKLEGKGILEINIGSNGIKGKFGMGGFDLVGSLYTFGKRMSDKAALEAYAMQERVSKEEAETAYWGYVYGDWTQENTMARISSRRDELHIVDKMADGANAQTVQKADGSGRVITMKNTGDYHTNAVTLGHESYRDGIVSNKADQQRETFNAVLGHTSMADRMTQYGNSFSGLLAAEIEAYQRGDMNALMMDSLYNYSSDADYWKIEYNNDGTIGWSWDKSFNFNFADGSSLTPEEMAEYIKAKKIEIEDRRSGDKLLSDENHETTHAEQVMGNAFLDYLRKNTIRPYLNTGNIFDSFIEGTEGFADASVAARNLMSSKLSQSELDAMYKGLYAAQESGLLVKNKIGTLYDTSLPFVLNDGKDVTWITTQYGFDLLNGKIRNHSEVDLVVNDPKDEKYPTGKTKLVVPETSDITLSYGTNIGLKETFSLGNGSEILYGHMDANSIKAYLSQFGTEGVSITSNGKLVNVPGGMLTGYIGNTGSKTTGPHLHLGYRKLQFDESSGIFNLNTTNPNEYFSALKTISVTPYAKVTSGLQGISSTTDKLKLQHIMNYYQFVNNPNKNFNNKYNFSDFYSSYKNSMDSSAFTAATFMYLYKQGKLFQ